MLEGSASDHSMVDWRLIHVHDKIGVTATIFEAETDVLEELECLSYDLLRVMLGHVGGNTVC